MKTKAKLMTVDKLHYLIGISASDEDLEALQQLLKHIGETLADSAILIFQQAGSLQQSSLIQELQTQLVLPVQVAQDHQQIQANTVYLLPANRKIRLLQAHFQFSQALAESQTKAQTEAQTKTSLDDFFYNLAHEFQESVIAVILSGSDSDGAAGLAAIHQAGGCTLVQSPETSRFPNLSEAAIDLGCVDRVLTPAEIGKTINALLLQPKSQKQVVQDLEAFSEQSADLSSYRDPNVQTIFQRLSEHTGTDFLNYKPSTLCRRLEKRLTLLSLPDAEAYLQYLDNQPAELEQLFKTVMIGVTSFFRDPEAFASLGQHLLEQLTHKQTPEPLRIWIPGCASGEEAYSIAFLLYDQLRDNWLNSEIQIFATDLDEQAITHARKGLFSRAALEGLSPEQIRKYFTQHGDSYEVIKPIRSRILFTKHDVTANPPFLKLDLISCRNLLIYFNAHLQKQLMPIFHYALNPGGILFLGKSESVNEFSDLFEPLDPESKLFRRKRGSNLRSIHFSAFRPHRQTSMELNMLRRKNASTLSELVKETLFASFEHPYAIINESLDVQEISGDVRLYLGLGEGQIKPSILRLIHPELQLELMSTITRAMRENSPVRSEICRFEFFGHQHQVRFSIKPLLFTQKGQDLFLVIFEAVELLDQPLTISDRSDSNRALEQELTALKTQMQNYIEELETSNEELQSLNEELQSTNEELQSSNEELETSNEELQSTYEEVQVAYAELQSSNQLLEANRRQLREADTHMRALVNNTLQSFLLLDPQGRLMLFNDEAERLVRRICGTRLKIGQPLVDSLRPELQPRFESRFAQVQRGEKLHGEFLITDLAGQDCWLAFHYTLAHDSDTGLKAISLSLLDITTTVQAQQNLRAQDLRFRSLIENGYDGIAILNAKGCFEYISPSIKHLLGYSPEELQGQLITDYLHPDHVEVFSRRHAQTAARPSASSEGQWRQRHADGNWIWIEGTSLNLQQIPEIGGIILNFRDISERKQNEDALSLSEARLRQVIDLIPAYIYARDAAGQYLLANALTARAFRRQPHEVEGHSHEELSPLYPFSAESLKADREVVNTGTIKLLPEERVLLDPSRDQILRTYKIPYVSSDTGHPAALTVSLDITELKRSEASLRKSEANLRTILESGQTSYLLLDRRLRTVTYNRLAAHWTQAELNVQLYEGMQLSEMVSAERYPALLALAERVLAGEAICYETCYLQPDGSHRWYQVRLDPVSAPQRVANPQLANILGICYATTDITQQKQAQQRLRENEAHLLASQQIAHIGSWELDLSQTVNVTSNALQWSDECFRIFGYEPGEVAVTNELFYQHVHPDDHQAIANAVAEAIEISGIYSIEHRIQRKDGSERLVAERGELMHDIHTGNRLKMIGTIQDITEQRRVEQHIRESEAHLRASQKIAKVGSWEISLINPVLNANEQNWSDECYRIFGFEPQSVKPDVDLFFSLVPPEDQLRLQAALERTLKDGEVYSIEHRLQLSDGSLRDVHERADVIFNQHGQAIKLLGTVQDITERKQADNQRNQQLAEILQRNQTLEHFASSLSQSLHSPVSQISNCVDLLQQTDSQAEQTQNLKSLADSTRQLDEMMQELHQLLKFSSSVDCEP